MLRIGLYPYSGDMKVSVFSVTHVTSYFILQDVGVD